MSKEVVHEPYAVEPGVFGAARDAGQRARDFRGAAGPGEVGNLQTDFHRALLQGFDLQTQSSPRQPRVTGDPEKML
jgi:hypothetical protein